MEKMDVEEVPKKPRNKIILCVLTLSVSSLLLIFVIVVLVTKHPPSKVSTNFLKWYL